MSTTTGYDPFDRPAVRSVVKGAAGTAKKTRFNYLGLSKQVAGEEQTDTGGAWKLTKVYTYGPDGKPLALTTTPIDGGAGKTRYYSTNTHGDTEALTDPTSGDVKASYRYTAYGSEDANGTLGEDKTPTTGGPADEVLNPYRYSSKRLDPATGSYDMGFRTYNPGLNSFLTRDMYNGALADLSLGLDPWGANRYAFVGGNPITRVELDGHRPVDINGDELPCYDVWNPRHDTAVDLRAAELEGTSGIVGVPGKVTTSRAENSIAGGSSVNPGDENGYADMILWGEDKVYVWEFKHAGGEAEEQGQAQVDNYVEYLQAQLLKKDPDDRRTVVHGFPFLASASGPNKANPNERITVSTKTTPRAARGVEIYTWSDDQCICPKVGDEKEEGGASMAEIVAASALGVAAVGLVVGTIAEDFLTGGLGILDDPASFATAAALGRSAFELAA